MSWPAIVGASLLEHPSSPSWHRETVTGTQKRVGEHAFACGQESTFEGAAAEHSYVYAQAC